jgi:hypothetical protein
VHHIIPRPYGKDDMDNLVTLCHECHDFVEIEKLTTLDDILSSYEDGEVEMPEQKPIKDAERERPNWHSFVYGGDKNPSL